MSSIVPGFELGFESLKDKVSEIVGSRRAQIYDAVNLIGNAVASAGINMQELDLPQPTREMMAGQRDADTLAHIQNLMQGAGSVSREIVTEVVEPPKGVIQESLDADDARTKLNAIYSQNTQPDGAEI